MKKQTTRILIAGFLLFILIGWPFGPGRAYSADDSAGVVEETGVETEENGEQEEEIKEAERERLRKERAKSRARREYKYGLDLVGGIGWRENVFHGAQFRGVEDPNEDAALLFGDFFSYLDVPLSERWTLENELAGHFEEFDTLGAADQRGLEVETEAHYRPDEKWDAWLGGQVMRELGKEDYHFPFEESSDDYYRYDGYAGVERQLSDSDWLRGIYRFVYKDYDEIPGEDSDDYDEHRIEGRWKHRFNKDFRSYLYGEARFRDYDEKFGRDREGNAVDGEMRERNIYEYGVNFYWDVARDSLLRFGAEMNHTRDPFEGYYDYDSYELSASLDHPVTERIYAEWDFSFEDRDYRRRLFFVPGTDVPITKYDIYEAGFLLGYEFSKTYRVEFEYDGEWVETNLDLKTHDMHTFRMQLGISL